MGIEPHTLLIGRPAGTWPDALLLDLDGVVYTDETAMPGAVPTMIAAHAQGIAVRYITNNAFRTREQVAARLNRIGVAATAAEVITSSTVAAGVLAARRAAGLLAGNRVAVVGGPGLADPLSDAGFDVVQAVDARGDVAAVVQGFSPQLQWADLAAASRLVRAGVYWLATNLDLTLPTDDGPAPGNGSMVRAVQTAAGRGPDDVAGKPAPAMFHQAAADAGAVDPGAVLVVGDRLDTDIAGAVAAGCPAMLVLTGVHGIADAAVARPNERPTHVGGTLADVTNEHPATAVDSPGRARCRDAAALVDIGPSGEIRECTVSMGRGAAGTDDLDAARALLTAAWSALDAMADPATLARATAGLIGHPTVSQLDAATRARAAR